MITDGEVMTPLNDAISTFPELSPKQITDVKSKLQKMLDMLERLE